MVTALLVPTFLLANVPAMPLVEMVTVSPATTPTNAGELVVSVAVTPWSYTLLLAPMPVTVSVFAVMSAVVVG